MAAERVQQDGFASSKDRRISDSNLPPNKTDSQNPVHYNNGPQQQQQHHHHHHHAHDQRHHHGSNSKQTTFDVSRAEFEQFQQQVSYNYECIQDHKRRMTEVENALSYFRQDFTRAIDDLRGELRNRNPATGPAPPGARHDSRDVEMLASQLTSINSKVNEIDNVKIQMQLLKTKLERLESESSSHSLQVPPRPGTASSFRDSQPTQDAPPPPHAHGSHQHLPPIQTGSLATDGARHHTFASNAMIDPALRGDQRGPPADQRYPSARPSEPLPPPSSMSTWRPGTGPPPYSGNDAARDGWPHTTSQPLKRPHDDHATREHSDPASPKRPKLAPLKPRSGYDEPHHPNYPPAETVPYHNAPPRPPPQHEGPPPPQLLTTPASATATTSPYRFITSTLPAENHDNWRSDEGAARARAANRHPVRSRSRAHGDKELDTPEWEQKQLDWHSQNPNPPNAPPSQQQQLSPNGYYGSGPRPPPMMTPGEGQPDYLLTPIASAVSPHEHSLQMQDTITPFSGKKTRTKPVRNSEGVLIRKDGRPDMRSVSSANNLRKVHAKKEAERAETDGRTPVSARPLAPSQSNSVSDEDEMHVEQSRSATPSKPLDEDGHSRKELRQEPGPVTGLVTPADEKSAIVIDSREQEHRRPAAKVEAV